MWHSQASAILRILSQLLVQLQTEQQYWEKEVKRVNELV